MNEDFRNEAAAAAEGKQWIGTMYIDWLTIDAFQQPTDYSRNASITTENHKIHVHFYTPNMQLNWLLLSAFSAFLRRFN